MFLRRTARRQTVVAVEGAVVRRSSHQHPSPRALPIGNIVSYIVRKYAKNGHIKLPTSVGGHAFANALRAKGIQVD
jgi:hypothetical protein